MGNKQNKGKSSLSILILTGVLLIIVIAMLPGYFRGGDWSWQQEKSPANSRLLNQLRQEGIVLEEWENLARKSVRLSGKNWSWQTMHKEGKNITLLIHPQPYYKDKPTVEWTDLQGLNINASVCFGQIADTLPLKPSEIGIESSANSVEELINHPNVTKEELTKVLSLLPDICSDIFTIGQFEGKAVISPLSDTRDWDTDSRQIISFQDENDNSIKAIFERGWNTKQTVAIVNWYGWDSGGDYRPKIWFIKDLKAQLKGERAGWYAVSLRINIPPLEEIEPWKEEAQQLAQEVQNAILEKITLTSE